MKKIIITTSWDDGHKLDLKLAKLLKKYGIKGTFYVCPNNREFNKKDLLSNNEIKQLSKDFEIGGHTMTHPILTNLNESEVYREIKGSKHFIEKLTGKKVEMFCYPRGMYNNITKRLVKRTGFIGARTIKPFVIFPSEDLFEFGTTIHIFNPILRYYVPKVIKNNFLLLPCLSRNLKKMVERIIKKIGKERGVLHIWGHSWEIEKYDLWRQLEEILKYLSENKKFIHLDNGATVKYLKNKND